MMPLTNPMDLLGSPLDSLISRFINEVDLTATKEFVARLRSRYAEARNAGEKLRLLEDAWIGHAPPISEDIANEIDAYLKDSKNSAPNNDEIVNIIPTLVKKEMLFGNDRRGSSTRDKNAEGRSSRNHSHKSITFRFKRLETSTDSSPNTTSRVSPILAQASESSTESTTAYDAKLIPHIVLFEGDITKLKTTFLVNGATNGDGIGCMLPDHLCLENRIHRMAGPLLRKACREDMKKQIWQRVCVNANVGGGSYVTYRASSYVTFGENRKIPNYDAFDTDSVVFSTKGNFGKLQCDYILHVKGPFIENRRIFPSQGANRKLRLSYSNSLDHAQLMFPSIAEEKERLRIEKEEEEESRKREEEERRRVALRDERISSDVENQSEFEGRVVIDGQMLNIVKKTEDETRVSTVVASPSSPRLLAFQTLENQILRSESPRGSNRDDATSNLDSNTKMRPSRGSNLSISISNVTNATKKSKGGVEGEDFYTICFPSISTGMFGYDNKKAAFCAIDTVESWIRENYDQNVKTEDANFKMATLVFCVETTEDFDIYKTYLTSPAPQGFAEYFEMV